jgi:hypothetical protein
LCIEIWYTHNLRVINWDGVLFVSWPSFDTPQRASWKARYGRFVKFIWCLSIGTSVHTLIVDCFDSSYVYGSCSDSTHLKFSWRLRGTTLYIIGRTLTCSHTKVYSRKSWLNFFFEHFLFNFFGDSAEVEMIIKIN